MLFRFLCVLWGYGSNHGDQLDVKVGPVLQTQALYVGRALLSAQPDATLEELAAADSPGKKSLVQTEEMGSDVMWTPPAPGLDSVSPP